ncbi:MAG: lysylphosphatidylglycerol synthase domain-containing protein [Bacteroidales bacterium]|nr:lysylphosphatidylglycerol synthase domain-containing protein [Bacteroidales bacterium]
MQCGYASFLLVQGLQMIAVFFILTGFGVSEQIVAYIFVFLVSSIIAIIPISVGGAGTRELAFMYGARYLSLSPELSVTVSLTFYLITLIVSLFGMIFSFKLPAIGLNK